MKNLNLICGLILLMSCASKAPVSYQEHCALKGMVLRGVTDSNSTGHAYGSNGTYATVSSEGEAVSCEVPKTPIETCEANRLAQIAAPKAEYNSKTSRYNTFIGIGYVLYILPGVAGSVVSSNYKDDAMAKSALVIESTKLACQPVADN